nr:acyl-CoA reductase [Sphingobacterium sp. SYP-B4668]
MTKEQRIKAFTELGQQLRKTPEYLAETIANAVYKNPWYTAPNVEQSISAISANLEESKLTNWLQPYPDVTSEKTVGLVLAGNIPLVGFHDILCVLLAGFKAQIKVSSDDAGLTTAILGLLVDVEPRFAERFQLVDRLHDFDLVIATGSDNSSRYFEYYFGKKPHIIRKNRNSIAVLSGNESSEQLQQLGHDIFDYFGLGCRSVSKIFVPKGYNVAHLFEGLEQFSAIGDHFKYNNNYDYNKSIYLINKDRHFDNGFLLLKEDDRTASPLAVLFFQEYDNIQQVEDTLNASAEQVQCITTAIALKTEIPTFQFGQSQCPALDDYADGINTLDFLFANQ